MAYVSTAAHLKNKMYKTACHLVWHMAGVIDLPDVNAVGSVIGAMPPSCRLVSLAIPLLVVTAEALFCDVRAC